MKNLLYFIFLVLCSCGHYSTKTTYLNPRNNIVLNNNIGVCDSISAIFYEEITNVKGINFAHYSSVRVRLINGFLLLDVSTIKKCDDIERCYQKGIFAYAVPHEYSAFAKKTGKNMPEIDLGMYDFLDSIPVSEYRILKKMPSKFYDEKKPVLFGFNTRKLTIKYFYGGKHEIWVPDCSSERAKLINLIEVPVYYIYDIKFDK